MKTPIINQVIDLSHHNAVDDFAEVRGFGIAGIIHKATEGTEYTDPLYASRVGPIRSHGMMHGAYHFGTGADGVTQAKHFLGAVNPDDRTLLALDLERSPKGATMTLEQARAFVTYVHEQTKRWPLLYSGDLIKTLLGHRRDPLLANCPLWIPRYGPEPSVQETWSAWNFWQYTQEGTVLGIQSHVDRSYYRGDLDSLRQTWGYPPLS